MSSTADHEHDRQHCLEIDSVAEGLNTDTEAGLASTEAQRRLTDSGPNALVERDVRGPWPILREQFTALLVIILLIAAAVSAALGDVLDAVVILCIVVANALLGFAQEYRAERSMAALKRLAVPTVRVVRDGHVVEISAADLVPGDVCVLEAGGVVPADGRVLDSVGLRVQEAALTGESEPVSKIDERSDASDLPLADRVNMLYRGTVVTFGRGRMLVTATGMDTELGHIATALQTIGREATPLQRRLDQLGRSLATIALVLVGIIFVLGLLRGEDPQLMFMTAVSMAVAAVPEGLPAVVTIVLALGAQRMLRRRALVRKLAAVEGLGSVTVICSDKTGTLTENRMRVTVLDVANQRLDVAEVNSHEQRSRDLDLLLVGSALCNDAVVEPQGVIGDPTETALVVIAESFGLLKPDLEVALPRVGELPFDAQRKRMTTVHAVCDTNMLPLPERALAFIAFTKGAVDGLLSLCSSVQVDTCLAPLDDIWRQRINTANDALAADGQRVLGLAYRAAAAPNDVAEDDLVFVGLVSMIDPPRSEARRAVETCQQAGIRVLMITGDHPLTAQYVARSLGLAGADVHARVSPDDKLRIVSDLQVGGDVVAMTGDGVNDAPALKKADVGVAMGITGTDVSKEAADIVLLDDNFATIVAAVEEGRVIYDNIRKFIRYLLTTNSGELWVMLIAPFLGMPLPLLPLQILWVNLVTDGLPGLALGLEPAERAVMRRPPTPPGEHILARGLGGHVAWVGLLMAAVTLGIGFVPWRAGEVQWQTLVFTTLVFAQMAHVLAIRSERDSLFALGLASNPLLLGAVLLTMGLQVVLVYAPLAQASFETVPLSPGELGLSVAAAAIVFWAVEVEKWFARRRIAR